MRYGIAVVAIPDQGRPGNVMSVIELMQKLEEQSHQLSHQLESSSVDTIAATS